MSSILNLNDTTPAAASGFQLSKWQRASTPAGADPTTGLPYYDVSTEVPNTGGVSVKTADYTLAAGDCGRLVVLNSASAHTFTLPATPPSVGSNQWQVAVANEGAGTLTLAVTSPTLLDGAGSSITLASNTGLVILTDGTNYYTQRGAAAVIPSGGVSTKTAGYTALAGDNGTLLAFNSASAVTLTLPATPPSATWRIAVQNVGAGTLTVSRNGLLIDTAAANLTLAQNAGVLVYTDGTNYFTERGSATGLPSGAANLVVATPDGSSGASSLRALVAADIPALPESKITSLTSDLAAKAPTSRLINTTAPLTGGGDLTADRTLAVSAATSSTLGVVKPDGTSITVTSGVLSATGSAVVSPIVLLQYAQGVGSTSGTATATFTNAVQRGSLIVVEFYGQTTSPTLTDTDSSTYTPYNSGSFGSDFCIQFVAAPVAGGSSYTITATGCGAIGILAIYEYANAELVDASSSAVGGTSVSTGTATANFPTEVVHMTAESGSPSGTLTNANGWAAIQTVSSSLANLTIQSWYASLAAAGGVSNTANGLNSLHGYAAILLLKPRLNTITSPMTTTGDIIIGGTGGTPTRLAASATAGYVLTGAGAGVAPSWQPVTGGGGGGGGSQILLAELTASTSASLNFATRNVTGQSGAMFQLDYDLYVIEFIELVPVTAGVAASMRVSTNGGSTYDSAANYWWAGFRNSAGGTAVAGGSARTSMDMSSSGNVGNTANKGGFSGTLKVFSPMGGTIFTRFLGNNSVWAGSEYVTTQFTGSYELVTAINAFQFFYSSGNIASGIIRVYGIAR